MSDDGFVFRAFVTKIVAPFGVTLEEALGRSRLRHIVIARFHVWRALRERGWSMPAIARRFGKHHTTILNGLRSLAELEGTTRHDAQD